MKVTSKFHLNFRGHFVLFIRNNMKLSECDV